MREFALRHRGILAFVLLAVAFGAVAYGLWPRPADNARGSQAGLQAEALEALRTMQAQNDALVAELDALKASVASGAAQPPTDHAGEVAGARDAVTPEASVSDK